MKNKSVYYTMLPESNYIGEDESLVKEIKDGDKDSFKELYNKYFHPLLRFALYRTNSMDLSEEAVQELFSRIWLKKELLDPGKPVKAYLYKSLSNIIINKNKLLSSKNISLEDKKIIITPSSGEDREFAMDIKDAVDNMPDKIKDVFLLSRVEGYMYCEIAEICGISEKAVEKRMSKAFKILRKRLTEKYFIT